MNPMVESAKKETSPEKSKSWKMIGLVKGLRKRNYSSLGARASTKKAKMLWLKCHV